MLRLAFNIGEQVCVINSSQEFQAINLHTEDVHVHVPFSKQENNFLTKLRHFRLRDNFQVRLQYGLYNQLLPEFSSIQFETLHRHYKHIEDMHVTFCRQ